jgi:hypothetical protein
LEAGDTRGATADFRRSLDVSYPYQGAARAVAPLAATSPLQLLAVTAAESASRVGSMLQATTRPLAVQYLKLLEAHVN